MLLSNKNYILLVLTFTGLYANVTAFAAVISSLTKPYLYQGKDNAILGASFIVFGMVG